MFCWTAAYFQCQLLKKGLARCLAERLARCRHAGSSQEVCRGRNIHSKKVSSAEQELAVLEAEALGAALRALNHMKVWNSHLCKPEALCALSPGDRRRVF